MRAWISIKKILRQIRQCIPSCLLAPIMPCLGWGPLTHSYINNRILHHLDKLEPQKDFDVKKLLSGKENSDLFILYAGYPDVIKAKGFLKGDTSYDYAHNPLPNRYYGQPQFSSLLLKHFRKQEDNELIIMALSWRAHQVADVFAHHVPTETFWGYVNRENFFGPFWPEVLEHYGDKNLGSLPGAFYRADHWISEMIIDLFCYIENGPEWGKNVLKDAPVRPLKYMPWISAEYLDRYGKSLKHEYKEIAPIQVKEMIRGKQFCDILNIATWRYYDSLITKRSLKSVSRMIANHAKFTGLKGMLEYVAFESARAIVNPSSEWKAPTVDRNLFADGSSSVDKVFPGFLTEKDYDYYFSEELETHWQNYQSNREGIVKLVLETIPLKPVRWVVQHLPLVTSGNIINRILLPKGKNSYTLSLRYAFNIRERSEQDFISILRKSLEESDVISTKEEKL